MGRRSDEEKLLAIAQIITHALEEYKPTYLELETVWKEQMHSSMGDLPDESTDEVLPEEGIIGSLSEKLGIMGRKAGQGSY